MADLLVLPRPANAAELPQASAEKFEHTGPAEKERVASAPQKEHVAVVTFNIPCNIYQLRILVDNIIFDFISNPDFISNLCSH